MSNKRRRTNEIDDVDTDEVADFLNENSFLYKAIQSCIAIRKNSINFIDKNNIIDVSNHIIEYIKYILDRYFENFDVARYEEGKINNEVVEIQFCIRGPINGDELKISSSHIFINELLISITNQFKLFNIPLVIKRGDEFNNMMFIDISVKNFNKLVEGRKF